MLIINNRFLSLYDYNFLLVIEKIFSAMDWMVVSMAELFYHMKVKNVIIDFLLVIQIIGFQNESCILEPIIFCITNEISFRIISLSSDQK